MILNLDEHPIDERPGKGDDVERFEPERPRQTGLWVAFVLLACACVAAGVHGYRILRNTGIDVAQEPSRQRPRHNGLGNHELPHGGPVESDHASDDGDQKNMDDCLEINHSLLSILPQRTAGARLRRPPRLFPLIARGPRPGDRF